MDVLSYPKVLVFCMNRFKSLQQNVTVHNKWVNLKNNSHWSQIQTSEQDGLKVRSNNLVGEMRNLTINFASFSTYLELNGSNYSNV